MNDPLYLQQAYRTPNEPKVPSFVKNSFVFVPTAGMRLAPEVLILELMREVFFKDFADRARAKKLDPDKMSDERHYCIADNKRAVLYALRGRRKMSRASAAQVFFAPAYPALAEKAWLRKNEARVINNFLLGGPIAQDLWHKGPDVEDKTIEQEEIAKKIRKALLGANSYFEESPVRKDILAVALGKDAFSNSFSLSDKLAIDRLKAKTRSTSLIMRADHDELACCISADTMAICELEEELPRMQWLHVLMTFLRFSLPMWLLAQMRITDLLHAWLLDAVDNETLPDARAVSRDITGRNRGLLHPTLTATRELFERIEGYMKRRIELSILLYCIEQARPGWMEGKTLSIEEGGTKLVGIDDLLVTAREAAGDIKAMGRFSKVADGHSISTFLTREGEQFPGWRTPLMRGQGKNIDEFFRVLYRAEMGDEVGGYLLTPRGRGRSRGFRVFPGQLLLKTVTFLAAKSKESGQEHGGVGKLVLQDVENRFAQYGVEFSSAADARPLLMRKLQAMGLLTGSPDAGSNVAVACPY